MISASASQQIQQSRIRKLNISRDLDQVADLIEQCFPIHLDQDGQTYIREMRKTAREMRFFGWLSSLSDLDNKKAPGFIWEEDGQILGNLSLIPFKDQGKDICLIANVAVDSNHRRRGIARALTNHALAYLRRRHISQIWLQVRDDNPAAIHLYHSTGFVDHVVRTTWRIKPGHYKPSEEGDALNVNVVKRKKEDWDDQKRWLLQFYPLTIRWNLSVDFSLFEPGWLQNILNIINGVWFKHWSLKSQTECLGVITWQKTSNYANNIWLAFPNDVESSVFSYGLQRVMKRLSGKHPISIDYPKGHFEEEFKAGGFKEFRSLIWMKQNLI